MAVDSGEVARVVDAASHSQKTPFRKIALVSPQKSPVFPKKSPVFPKKSPTPPQKSHGCEMVCGLRLGRLFLFLISLFLSLFFVYFPLMWFLVLYQALVYIYIYTYRRVCI